MLKNHSLAKAISGASWSTFAHMLTYKASWCERTRSKADAFYASSQSFAMSVGTKTMNSKTSPSG